MPSYAEFQHLQSQPTTNGDDLDATYRLAEYYFNGGQYFDGVIIQNKVEARRLYSLAAQKRHFNSINRLWLCCKEGYGGDIDYVQAVRWLTMATNNPDDLSTVATAAYELGNCYNAGLGVPQNYGTAKYWYRQAANFGYPNMHAEHTYTRCCPVTYCNLCCAQFCCANEAPTHRCCTYPCSATQGVRALQRSVTPLICGAFYGLLPPLALMLAGLWDSAIFCSCYCCSEARHHVYHHKDPHIYPSRMKMRTTFPAVENYH